MRPNLSPADESIRFLANHPRGAACVKAHLDFTIAAKRSGGFLGAGEKDVAVPFRSVSLVSAGVCFACALRRGYGIVCQHGRR